MNQQSTSQSLSSDLLISWELGGGMGHMTRLWPIVERAKLAGLSVQCMAIQKETAEKLLACPVKEAPWIRAPKHRSPPHIGHIADTLAALGWSDTKHLWSAVSRWRDAIKQIQPRSIVMDSSPVALLATQGLPIKRVWVADGWNTPPKVSPLPDMATEILGIKRDAADTEARVVDSINQALVRLEQPTISMLAELFERTDLSDLLTFPELDPFGPRKKKSYRGIWGMPHDNSIRSLGSDVPRVFAYLKPFPNRAVVLQLLAVSTLPALVYAPSATRIELQAILGSKIKLVDKPIDWRLLANHLTFVIGHASPGITGLSLLMGVPLVGIPLSLEQSAIARRAAQTGALIEAQYHDPESIRSALYRILVDDSFTLAAHRFAEKYSNFDPDREAMRFGDEVAALTKRSSTS